MLWINHNSAILLGFTIFVGLAFLLVRDGIKTRDILLLAAVIAVLCAVWLCAASGPPLNRAQKEEFLRNAKVVRTSGAKLGITGTTRATLSDGRITHDASVQTIDESKNQHQTAMGMELNFRDTYRFNIAAYKLDRLLGLNMIPVVVERSYRGQKGSYCWWVDDTLMVELERFEKKVSPPNPDLWNKQMYVVRVFDQLIYNTDRNLGNLVIDKEWRIWMIDHSRAFRMRTDLKEPKNLVQCIRFPWRENEVKFIYLNAPKF